MTPIDDELRSALHGRADALGTPLTDPLTGIERRARGMRRRRRLAAVGGSTALVVALAVGIPASLGSFSASESPSRFAGQPGGDTGRSAVATTPMACSTPPTTGCRPASSESPGAASPSPAAGTASPSATAGRSPVSATGAPVVAAWPVTGNAVLAKKAEQAADAALAEQFATGPYAVGGGRVIWAGMLADDREAVVVVGVKKAPSPDAGMVAAVYLPVSGQLVAAHDLPVNATQVSAVIPPGPAGGVPYVVVVGAPGTGKITYAVDGTHFQPVEQLSGYRGDSAAGWATFPRVRPANAPHVDAIAVYSAGDGTLRYRDMPGRGVNFPDV